MRRLPATAPPPTRLNTVLSTSQADIGERPRAHQRKQSTPCDSVGSADAEAVAMAPAGGKDCGDRLFQNGPNSETPTWLNGARVTDPFVWGYLDSVVVSTENRKYEFFHWICENSSSEIYDLYSFGKRNELFHETHN